MRISDWSSDVCSSDLVTIEVQPHRFFTRDGDDVRLDLPVSLAEAVLGTKVRAPTVDGAVNLTIAKGSSSGKVLRLKGKGFHKKGGGRGDQLVMLMIDLPADATALADFVRSDERRVGKACVMTCRSRCVAEQL